MSIKSNKIDIAPFIKESSLELKPTTQSNLQPKAKDAEPKYGVISQPSKETTMSDLPINWELLTLCKVEVDGHETIGLPGVSTVYRTIFDGLYTILDPNGLALLVNGLETGVRQVYEDCTAQRAKALMKKHGVWAYPVECSYGYSSDDDRFKMSVRIFNTPEAALAAAELLGLDTNNGDDLRDVQATAKRRKRDEEALFCGVEHKATGDFIFVDGLNGRVSKIRKPRIFWDQDPSHASRDGSACIYRSYAEYMSESFEPGSRWGKMNMYGSGAIENELDGGQVKAMSYVAEVDHPLWDIVIYDGPKKELRKNGLFMLAFGTEAHSGGRQYTDLMLCNLSDKYSEYCLEADHNLVIDNLKGVKEHLTKSNLDEVWIDKDTDGLTSGALTEREKQRAIAKVVREKQKLRPEGSDKSTNSMAIQAAMLGIDVSLCPLLVSRYLYFTIGEEGDRATRYRVAQPNGIMVEMIIWDPDAYPVSDRYPEPARGEIVVTKSTAGVVVCYCHPEDFNPKDRDGISARTGGSDMDDRWDIKAFKLKDGLHYMLTRQPHGPGDGYFGRLTLLNETEELFAHIPRGKKALEMWEELVDQTMAVRALEAELPELQRVIDAANSDTRMEKSNNTEPDIKKQYKAMGTDINFKKPTKPSKAFKALGNKAISNKWHEYNGPRGVSIGQLTNLMAICLRRFNDDKACATIKWFLGMLQKHGLVEIAVDQQMGKASAEDLNLLSHVYFTTKAIIRTVEKAHVIGSSANFKSRFTTIKSVFVPNLFTYFRKDFKFDESVDDTLRAKVIAISEREDCVTKVAQRKFFNQKGKVEIMKAAGLEVYEGFLSEFYDGIHKTYSDARNYVTQFSLDFRIRWYKEFLSSFDTIDADILNTHMHNIVGSHYIGAVGTVIKAWSNLDDDFDQKCEVIVNYINKNIKDPEEFFTALVWADIFQLRARRRKGEKRDEYYSDLASRSGRGFTSPGWLDKAQEGLMTLYVLQQAQKNGVHPSEIEHCTDDAISVHETGYVTRQGRRGPYSISLEDAYNLRTLAAIPKGPVVEYDNGEPVRDNSWCIKGRTLQDWYISAYANVADTLNK